jgi:hypothetical protein
VEGVTAQEIGSACEGDHRDGDEAHEHDRQGGLPR